MMDWTAQIWTLARPGHAVAILGAPVPPPPPGWRAVRVYCADGAPLGPFHQARALIGQRAGARPDEPVVQRVASGLRRRLLGEPATLDDAGPLLTELNRLADGTEKTAILLDDVDRADPSTVALLRRIVAAPGWLRPALVLSVAVMPETGPLAELLRGLERDGALLRAALPELPPPILRALRALAVVGGEASAAQLAELLGEDELRVLERAQEALDLGFPIADRGEGRLWMPPEQAAALRSGVMPSLSEAWRRRIGSLGDPEPRVERRVEPPRAAAPPEPFGAMRFAPDARPPEQIAAEPASKPEVWPELTPAPEAAQEPAPAVEIWPELTPAPEAAQEPAPTIEPTSEIWPELIPAPEAAPEPPPPKQPAPQIWPDLPSQSQPSERLHRARPPKPPPAASWGPPALTPPEPPRPAEAVDAALHALLANVAEAPTYAAPQVIAQLHEAQALLERMPTTPARQALRARVHMELGRVAWQDAGLMPGLNLDAALNELEGAARVLDALPNEPRLRAELRVLVASVCYDRGDAESLERALRELTEAIRAFSALGDPRTAARLLNDQAAVWVRIGDVVRAAHLLRQSRELMQGLGEAADQADLAETNHLLARLPLHVPSRPGRERDALRQALVHAKDAEATYAALQMRREQARVWCTLGRLHLLLDEGPTAIGVLHQAFTLQERIGDALGLAGTAGALAEALQSQGEAAQAVEMLSASIALNANLGSAAGLHHNREVHDAFSRAVPPDQAPLRQALAKLGRVLDQAEARQRR